MKIWIFHNRKLQPKIVVSIFSTIELVSFRRFFVFKIIASDCDQSILCSPFYEVLWKFFPVQLSLLSEVEQSLFYSAHLGHSKNTCNLYYLCTLNKFRLPSLEIRSFCRQYFHCYHISQLIQFCWHYQGAI